MTHLQWSLDGPRACCVTSLSSAHFESVKRPARSCIVVDQVSEASGSDPAPLEARSGRRGIGALAVRRRSAPAAPRWAWGVLLLVCAMNVLDSAITGCLQRSFPRCVRSSISPRARRAGSRRSCCSPWRFASPLIGYVVDRFSAAAPAGAGVCTLEPGDGLDRAGAHERAVAGGASAGGRRRCDLCRDRA